MIELLALIAAGVLIAVWVVYPLVIGLAAALTRPLRADRPEAKPLVSVVLATRDAHAAVLERVANCLDTDHPADLLEVVIARDGGPDGDGVPLTLPGCRARVIAVTADAPGGKACALNAGVRASRGAVLVFADTAQRFRRDTIPELVRGLAADRVGAVSGSLEVSGSSLAALYWKYERTLRRFEARVHSSIGATGAVYAIRRSLWQPLPPGLLLDDVYTPMRIVLAGWRVAFSTRARAVDTRRPTPRQEYARKVRTLTGVFQLCAWLPAVLVPWRNPTWFQFVFHKLLRMTTPYAMGLIALWAVASAARMAGPAAPIAGAVAAVALLGLARVPLPLAARLRRLAAEGALIQWAVIAAGVNGLRGRWEVWDA